MNMRTMTHIWEQGVHSTAIFTEASKSEDGRTAGAYHVGGTNVEEQFRITSNNTIYTTELIVIRQAVRWIDATNVKDANIYSDSLSALQSFKTGSSSSRPCLIQEIIHDITKLKKRGINLELHWIPSHVGVGGNEKVDEMAEMALNHEDTDVVVNKELKDVYKEIDRTTNGDVAEKVERRDNRNEIDRTTMEMWQKRWNEGITGRRSTERRWRCGRRGGTKE